MVLIAGIANFLLSVPVSRVNGGGIKRLNPGLGAECLEMVHRSALMSFPHLPVRFPLLLQFSLNSIRGEPGLGVDHFPHHYFIVYISLLPKRPAHFSTVNYLYTEAQKRSSIFASRSLQGLAFDSLTLSHCCLSGPLPWL